MARAPLRRLTALLAAAAALVPAACGSGTLSRNPPTSFAPAVAPSASPLTSPIPAVAPSASPLTSPTAAVAPSSSSRPPAGTGLMGRTVVLNCPVERADPPCPATPVRAHVVVLDRAGKTTLATVDTGGDGRFTVALPAGRYVIRAAGLGGNTARRPAVRPVTVAAGSFTTVTIRLVTGLR